MFQKFKIRDIPENIDFKFDNKRIKKELFNDNVKNYHSLISNNFLTINSSYYSILYSHRYKFGNIHRRIHRRII